MVAKFIICCTYKDVIGGTKTMTRFLEYFRIIRKC